MLPDLQFVSYDRAVEVRGAALAVGIALLVAPSALARVPVTVKPVDSCSPVTLRVRLVDGTIARVRHARPGKTVRQVRPKSKGLVLSVRIGSPWRTVTGGRGHRLRVRAKGPDGEVWQWMYGLRARRPIAADTDYRVCLVMRTDQAEPFITYLRTRPGDWTFEAKVVRGRLSGSVGSAPVTVLEK